ncbi:unnamed protein product [Amaranthus hypochondriacus]
MVYIPYEIIEKIIYCLPPKSVVAFKAVSRYFNAFISDPNFIPSYISLHPDPSWFVFQQTLPFSPNYRFPIELIFKTPPNLSTISIHVPELGPYYPLTILHALVASSGELLLVADKLSRMPQEGPSGCHLFVINAITKEWVALPKPGFYFDHTHPNFGLIAQIDRDNRVFREFRVAAYLQSTTDHLAFLLCFSSETARWEMKLTNYMIEDHIWGWSGGGNFEFQGKLIWYDLNVGLIIWDDPFSTERVVQCRLIMLPIQFVRSNVEAIDDQRLITHSGGLIQFFRLSNTSMVTLWRLRNLEDGSWNPPYEWNLRNVIPNCSNLNIMPVLCHPFEYGVAIFRNGSVLISAEINTARVRGVGTIPTRNYIHLFSVVLPSWPSFFTPIMHGRFLKEHGDQSFVDRRYEDAIYFYTRSITYREDVLVYMSRAKTYNKLHRSHEAIQDFLKAIEIDSHLYYAYRAEDVVRLSNQQV